MDSTDTPLPPQPPHVTQLCGGLCNRLRAMLGLREVSRPIRVKWPVGGDCPGRFLDVFEPLDGVEFDDAQPTRRTNQTFPHILKAAGQRHTPAREVAAYGDLVPARALRRRLRELRDQGLNGWKGCHIRRTDHVGLATRHGRVVAEEDYRIWCGAEPVFLATDSPGVQGRWRAFPNVRTAAALVLRGLRKSSLADAVVDLFALALCREFMGSFYSSFTNTVQILRKVPPALQERWLAE